MKTLTRIMLCVLLIAFLSSCAYFRKEGPGNIHCPACNYIIDDRWS